VQWPKGEQRKLVHEGFQSIGEFKNIIGAINGTHLILNDKPSNTPESYFNRKKFYSIQCQGIVDYRGIFISYDIGWPGSVHDAKIWDLDLNFEDESENQEFEEDDDNEELKLIGQQKRNDIMQQCIG